MIEDGDLCLADVDAVDRVPVHHDAAVACRGRADLSGDSFLTRGRMGAGRKKDRDLARGEAGCLSS